MSHRNSRLHAVKDTIEETVESMADSARGMVRKAGNIASRIEKAEEGAVASVGCRLKSVGKQLQVGGTYLEKHNLRSMLDDAMSVVRRHPLPALAIGLGTGFLIARAVNHRR